MELNQVKSFLDEKTEELNSLEGNDKYQVLMEYGDELEAFPEEDVVPENKIPGCTSGVYISHSIKDGRIYFKGKSESVVVRGYVAILVKSLSGLKVEDINKTEEFIEKFVTKTNVKASLTPQRANAFGNIFKRMKELSNL